MTPGAWSSDASAYLAVYICIVYRPYLAPHMPPGPAYTTWRPRNRGGPQCPISTEKGAQLNQIRRPGGAGDRRSEEGRAAAAAGYNPPRAHALFVAASYMDAFLLGLLLHRHARGNRSTKSKLVRLANRRAK